MVFGDRLVVISSNNMLNYPCIFRWRSSDPVSFIETFEYHRGLQGTHVAVEGSYNGRQ